MDEVRDGRVLGRRARTSVLGEETAMPEELPDEVVLDLGKEERHRLAAAATHECFRRMPTFDAGMRAERRSERDRARARLVVLRFASWALRLPSQASESEVEVFVGRQPPPERPEVRAALEAFRRT
jgi:hypothetical protein